MNTNKKPPGRHAGSEGVFARVERIRVMQRPRLSAGVALHSQAPAQSAQWEREFIFKKTAH